MSKCLQSICLQDYHTLQVVIVNDGGVSIDDVVAKFKTRLDIHVVQLASNEGRTAAANYGLREARGDYLCFLDDDDYWRENHLSSLVATLMSDSLSCVKTPAGFPECAVYSATKAILVDDDQQERDIKLFKVNFNRDHLLYENFLPIHSVLFSRTPVDKGVVFDLAFDHFEDWDFWLQISELIPFYLVDKTTAVYCLHAESSGVHENNNSALAYRKIYNKWLKKLPSDRWTDLVCQTHLWQSQVIDQLQSGNQQKLQEIGELHDQAIAVIQNKDQESANLVKEYEHAIAVIQKKDQQAAELASDYEYAIAVIHDKDEQASELVKEYEHAIAVIQDKDKEIAELVATIDQLRSKFEAQSLSNTKLQEQIALSEKRLRYPVSGFFKRHFGRKAE